MRLSAACFSLTVCFAVSVACTAPAEIVTFSDSQLEQAVRDWFSTNAAPLGATIDSNDLTGKGFTHLDASNRGINSLEGLQFALDLKQLNITKNNIADLGPLAALTLLQELRAGSNQISDLAPLQNLMGLTYLELGIGNIMNINERDSVVAALNTTNVNQLTDLSPLANLTGLTYLNVGGSTGITSIEVLTALVNLEGFVLTNASPVDFLPLASLDALQSIVLSGNGMQDSDVAYLNGLTNLKAIVLGYETALTDLGSLAALNPERVFFVGLGVTGYDFLSNYTAMKALTMRYCMISVLPDLSTTALESVSMAINGQLSDVSGLDGLTHLTHLTLRQSPVFDISALASLTGLEYLDLWMNNIADIQPLIDNNGLGGDDFVDLSSNPLSGASPSAACDQLPQFIAKFNTPDNVVTNAVCGNVVTLTINVDGAGIVFPSGGQIAYPLGQDALVVAFPSPGSAYAFQGWSGDLVSDNSFNTILMDGDKTITAHFVEPGNHTLSITAAGTSAGTAVLIPMAGDYGFLDGRTAQVFNFSQGNGFFSGWTGDVVDSSPFIEFPMDADKAVVANFVSEGYELGLSIRGKGGLNILPIPAQNLVRFNLATGLTFPIVAEPAAPEWAFERWEGDIGIHDPSSPTLPVTMNQNRYLTAVFSPLTTDFSLTILDSRDGSIPQNLEGFTQPSAGAYAHADGQEVSVEAFPAVGKRFAHWAGGVPEENRFDNPVAVTMDQDRFLKPVFIGESSPILTVTIVGNGTITTQIGIPIGPATFAYNAGYWSNLEAVCGPDTALLGWSGDIDAQNPSDRFISFPMNRDRAVTVTFVPAQWTLTIELIGTGVVTPPPGQYGFANGAAANLSASLLVDSGYAFQGWQGDAGTASSNDFGFTMNSDKTVQAVFVTPGQYTLTMNSPQGLDDGSTNLVPGVYSFLSGQHAYIQAFPYDGHYFSGWTGSISDENISVDLVMNNNKVVTPNFTTGGYTLTLNVTEGGWITGFGVGSYRYAAGQTVALVASPSTGYAFLEWQGDLPAGADATEPEQQVTINQSRSLTAVFVSTSHPLTVAVQGAGATTPAPGTYRYDIDANVTISAVPEVGGEFYGWQGDIGTADPDNPTLELTMDQARAVTAVFKEYDHTLTVNVTGAGDADPLGTTAVFANTSVSISAQPIVDTGYAFNRWTGDIASTDMQTNVLIEGDTSVTAEFITPGDFTLSVAVGGNAGTSSVNPGVGEFAFMNGQTFTLHAQAAPRHYFVQWTGDIDPNIAYAPTVSVTMDQSRSLTAVFEALTYHTVTVEMEGTGETAPPPGTYEYIDGNRVMLYAFDVLDSGYLFDRWEGDIGDSDPVQRALTFDIHEDRLVRAVFRTGDWNLGIAVRGSGETYPGVGSYAYLDGRTASVEALPYTGYELAQWEGDIGTADSHARIIQLTMTQDRTITAVFQPADSVFCHLLVPESPPYVSNTGIAYYTYDAFDGVTSRIQGLRFWGFAAHIVGSDFPACVREQNDFEVIFYADNGHGEPGEMAYQEQFFGLTGQNTGKKYYTYDILEYGVEFSEPLWITSGWLSVRGITDGDCWFLWSTSDDEDNGCLQYDPDEMLYEPKLGDAAFCLIAAEDDGIHSADTTQDMAINLTELLRVIQFFNTQGYHCLPGTEDGYGPGAGEDHHCAPHDSDYNPQDWTIALTELLRLIQFFNSGAYYACPEENTEDGYCVPLGE